MSYTDNEKQIAKEFIDCKIPDYIYDFDEVFNKKHNLPVDTMEYYEALFDFAHCILDDYSLESNFSTALRCKELYLLMEQQKNNLVEQNYFDKVSKLLEVIEKYKKLN